MRWIWRGLFIVYLGTISAVSGEDWNQMAKDSIKKALNRKINTNLAKNVILFIGDGMGVSTVTAARIYKGQKMNKTGEETILAFEEFQDVSLSKTYSADWQVSDSAATATAMLAGIKTNYFIVGADDKTIKDDCDSIKGHEVLTMIDHFKADGRGTGVVTNARITHATPASAYAHTPNRYWEGYNDVMNVSGDCKDIAHQLIHDNSDIQVVLGGGRRYFLPEGQLDPETNSADRKQRKDGVDLIQVWKDKQTSKGRRHSYVWNKGQFDSVSTSQTDYLLGLFQPSHMQYEVDRDKTAAGEPSLSEMTSKAIKILQRNEKGFFLMVEGGRIDHAHHDSFAKRALEETIELESAMKEALRLTNEEDTLIIVTADHSHVFNIGGYPKRGNDILGISHPQKEEPSLDEKPYTTLTYGNGPGFNLTGQRQNVSSVNLHDNNYQQQSAVPLSWETHGGEDVGIYARGPASYLIHGVQEQHYIAHVMGFASCLGEYNNDHCRTNRNVNSSPHSYGNPYFIFTILPTLVLSFVMFVFH